jgi:glycosyltransferase involved in cell wall biosynthesis
VRLLFATTHGHLPELVGGLQTTTDELAQALQRHGVEVAVLCAALDPNAPPPPADSCAYQVIRAPDPIAALPAIAAALEPSAIVVQTGRNMVRMLVAALDTARPAVVYLHNVEQSELGGVLLPDPDIRYLANSPFTAARWHAAYGLDSAVVPPYVERDAYVTATTRERILFVNPTMQKGVERFFQLAAARPALPFTAVESWTLDPVWRRYCQARAAALGNIAWCAPQHDMRTLYGTTRLLLMPSLWEESYGRTALEVQLSGIPVLASSRGNLVDTIGPGGITVDLHAPLGAWLGALDRLWAEAAAEGAYSVAARAHATRPDADPEHVVARFMDVVERHIAARTTTAA